MEDHEFGDDLRAVAGRPWLVAGTAAVVVALTLGVSLAQTPMYRAEAELLLGRTPSERVLFDDGAGYRSSADATREVNNELRLIESEVVRAAVDEAYGGDIPVDAVRADATSEEADVIELAATSSDPDAVTELVNTYADAYVAAHRDRQVDDLIGAGAEVQAQIDDLDLQIAAAAAAGRNTTSLDNQRSYFAEQLDQLQVTTQLARSGGVQVLTRADVPDEPSSPRVARNVVIGALAGLMAGLALALFRHRFDVAVRTKETCEAIVGRPALGLVPRTTRRGRHSPELVSAVEPGSAISEAYRALRTSMMFLGLDRDLTTVQVTSAVTSEGKTTVAANLATVLAQAGSRTLLVEADLRRPRLHEFFDVSQSPGLAAVLAGTASVDDAVLVIDEAPDLHVLPAGPAPGNPTELLASRQAAQVFTELARRYDFVVVDCPPVLPVADAQVLARLADVTLLVVSSGTSRHHVANAVDALGHVGAPLVGAVLNRVQGGAGYGGTYSRYGYAPAPTSRRARRRARARNGARPARPTGRPVATVESAQGNGSSDEAYATTLAAPGSPNPTAGHDG